MVVVGQAATLAGHRILHIQILSRLLAPSHPMSNQEHNNGINPTSVAFWLPIGAGVGAAMGVAMATVTGQSGSFTGISTTMVFAVIGVALGMSLVAALAAILPRR